MSDQVVRRFRICFVSPTNYAVLSGREDLTHIGGAQVQQWLIARELAGRGHGVSFVTHDDGQPEGVVHDGIQVFKMYARSDGVPVLRFFHPRWSSLCRAMRNADADVYYQRGAGLETGQVAGWCRRHRRKFVFAAALDDDCDKSLPFLQNGRERHFFRYGLRLASGVVVQTQAQKEQMRKSFQIDSALIRSCCIDPCLGTNERLEHGGLGERRVLWIGRVSPQKRLEMLIELAKRCPDVLFDVVGEDNANSAYAHSVLSSVRQLSNVVVHGRIPYARMSEVYARGALLVCTSRVEGFPNTFVEAWARGIPIVSTIDPDRLIARGQLGAVGRDATELAVGVRQLLDEAEFYDACSRNARHFYERNHTVEAAAKSYEAFLSCLLFGD